MKSALCERLGIEFPQGISMLDSVKSSRTVVREFMEDFADAALHLSELVSE